MRRVRNRALRRAQLYNDKIAGSLQNHVGSQQQTSTQKTTPFKTLLMPMVALSVRHELSWTPTTSVGVVLVSSVHLLASVEACLVLLICSQSQLQSHLLCPGRVMVGH
ncbi:unnamed protein product [Polarella glacialis]|uniref:Uncharacterized protein n=1 Tax=Polarella glacialis TaxID=89957 RepID=A0A813M1X9_POLGL|nr:unnamed protein product [Polarella glacialis]